MLIYSRAGEPRALIRRKSLRVVLPLLLVVLSTLSQTTHAARAAVYPPETRPLVFTSMLAMPRPGYLSPVKDPNTNHFTTRITDAAAFGVTSNTIKQAYAKIEPWNADGS